MPHKWNVTADLKDALENATDEDLRKVSAVLCDSGWKYQNDEKPHYPKPGEDS